MNISNSVSTAISNQATQLLKYKINGEIKYGYIMPIGETAQMADVQMKNIDQIREGIDDMSQVVQDNSAMAEETSATSEKLAAQSVTLNELVQKFELN